MARVFVVRGGERERAYDGERGHDWPELQRRARPCSVAAEAAGGGGGGGRGGDRGGVGGWRRALTDAVAAATTRCWGTPGGVSGRCRLRRR